MSTRSLTATREDLEGLRRSTAMASPGQSVILLREDLLLLLGHLQALHDRLDRVEARHERVLRVLATALTGLRPAARVLLALSESSPDTEARPGGG